MRNKELQIDRGRITKKNELRFRLIKAQSALPPRIDFWMYEHHFGALSPKKKMKVQNVWLFKSTDEKIIENFETLAKKNKIA